MKTQTLASQSQAGKLDTVADFVNAEVFAPVDAASWVLRLTRFVSAGPVVELSTDAKAWRDSAAAVKALGRLQRDVRRLVDDVIDAVAARAAGQRLGFTRGDHLPLAAGAVGLALRVSGDGVVVVDVEGKLHARVVHAVVALLASVPADTVRRCPQCGRYFVKASMGRPAVYCGRACTNAATWASVQADPTRLEAYRARAYAVRGWRRGARKGRK